MDWKSDVGTNLWIPRRAEWREARQDQTRSNGHRSTAASSQPATTFRRPTAPTRPAWSPISFGSWNRSTRLHKSKPGLTIAAWAQYALDSFATVEEAVTALASEPFTIVTDNVPGEARLATLHLSLSNSSGDSAIVEYIDGKQVIHHGRQYQVMTNSPIFDKQLALNEYWKQIGGTVMLPGTNRASDRFARASFYVNAIPHEAGTRSGDRQRLRRDPQRIGAPSAFNTPDEPNISSTRWRTVFDHKRKLYFFESALTPNVFWIDLKAIDFAAGGAGVRKLDLGSNQTHIYSGDTTREFKPTKPFEFLGLP